jgi:hypothetical protein
LAVIFSKLSFQADRVNPILKPYPPPVFEERTHGREKPGSERGWRMGFRLKEFGSSS